MPFNIDWQTIDDVLLDMDGTLLDTLEGHAKAFNRALKKLRMPQHPIDAYRYFIGNGAEACAEKSLPEDSKHLIKSCVSLFKQNYANSWNGTRTAKKANRGLKKPIIAR